MKKLCFPILMIILFLTGCQKETTSSPSETTDPKTDTITQIDDTQMSSEEYAYDYVLIKDGDFRTTLQELDSIVLLELENLSDQNYEVVMADIIFYDNENNMLSYSSFYCSDVFSNTIYKDTIDVPRNNMSEIVPFDHYEVSLKGAIKKGNFLDCTNDLSIESNISANGNVLAKIANNSEKTISSVNSYIEYYYNGTLVGISEGYCYDIIPSGYNIVEFFNPSDLNYMSVLYDDYKVIIRNAFRLE